MGDRITDLINKRINERIEKALDEKTAYKHTPASVAGVGPWSHGEGGLFSTPGQDLTMFSAMMIPGQSILDVLPLMPHGFSLPGIDEYYGGADVPRYTIITGVTQGASESLANQRVNPCDAPPKPGLLKLCTTTAPFGSFSQGVDQLDVRERNRLVNYAESFPTPAVNAEVFGQFTPQMAGSLNGDVLHREMSRRIWLAAFSMKRYMAPVAYTGTPNNNTAGNGYKEFVGLDTLINENNKVDLDMATVCTAANSHLRDFGNDLVDGSGRDIADYIDSLYFHLKYQARRNGLWPVTWKITMRPQLFEEITKVWPIRYHLDALVNMNNFTNGRAVIDATSATSVRDSMRVPGSEFLLIRGEKVDVILDDGIAEDTQLPVAGRYSSDIYFIPMTVLGGMPVTYLEVFRYFAEPLFPQEQYSHWTTDDRKFLWTRSEQRGCYEYTFEVAPRIVMRTTQLAGRIQNVAYQPLVHVREAYADSDYFFDGGRTNAPSGSFYTEWSTTTPVNIPGQPRQA